MKDKTLYLIVAKSGTGKDYITDKLCKEFGKKKVISRTTRKPRFKGEDTHLFISEGQADKEFNNAVAKTVFNGYRYYTTKEDCDNSDFYIIDTNGVKSIKDKSSMITVFIDSPWYIRAYHMRKRGDSIKSIISRLKHDRQAFKGFVGDLNFNSSDEYYEYFKEQFENERITYEYKMLDVIDKLSKDRSKKFLRINDENFKIYRDELGRLMCRIKDNPARTLNLFNYMQDLWREE